MTAAERLSPGVPNPSVQVDLATTFARREPDKRRGAPAIQIGLGESGCFVDAQPRSPRSTDQTAQPTAVCAIRQPFPHIRRHQKRLPTITRNTALAHPRIALVNPAERTRDLRDNLGRDQQSALLDEPPVAKPGLSRLASGVTRGSGRGLLARDSRRRVHVRTGGQTADSSRSGGRPRAKCSRSRRDGA